MMTTTKTDLSVQLQWRANGRVKARTISWPQFLEWFPERIPFGESATVFTPAGEVQHAEGRVFLPVTQYPGSRRDAWIVGDVNVLTEIVRRLCAGETAESIHESY